jgi:hypothetical protein
MEALEQEVFKYKKMVECEVELIHRINQELVTKYKKETTELWKDVFSLHETTNQLQAQLYDLQNQNCEYEDRFKQMSAATSFRTLETKTSFLDGGPLPWKYDSDEDSPPPLGLFQAWGSAAVSHHYLLLIYFSSRVIS